MAKKRRIPNYESEPRLWPSLLRTRDVEAAVSRFRELSRDPDSPIRAIHHEPARAAEYVPVPESVDGRVRAAPEKRGIARLYSHQGEALQAAEAGRNVVVVTPTASGKTLCCNLPVWNRLMREPDALHHFEMMYGERIRAATGRAN